MTLAKIQDLSLVRWLAARDRISANLFPVPPLAKLIQIVQYLLDFTWDTLLVLAVLVQILSTWYSSLTSFTIPYKAVK